MTRSWINISVIAAGAVAFGMSGSASAGLVDHYEFENNGFDSAGPPYADGTVGGDVSFGGGMYGQAAVFGTAASSTARIDVPQANAFTPGTGDFSIAFWVKRNEADTGDFDGVFDALSAGSVGYQAYFSAPQGAGHTDKLIIRLDDDNGNWLDCRSTTAFTDTTEWHHYAMVVSRSTDTYQLWADGVLDATVDISSITGAISPSHDLRIGQLSGSGGLDGSLDDLRFYDHVLTETEIGELAGIPAPGSLALFGLGFLGATRRRR